MKYKSLHIILFTMLFPFWVLAQEGNAINGSEFYYSLGIKDAKYELSLESVNIEDEKDFWQDQKAFEDRLKKENPEGHFFYLNGKSQIYRQHQIHCGGRCNHSEEFIRYKAFYVINGESSTKTDMAYTKENQSTKRKE